MSLNRNEKAAGLHTREMTFFDGEIGYELVSLRDEPFVDLCAIQPRDRAAAFDEQGGDAAITQYLHQLRHVHAARHPVALVAIGGRRHALAGNICDHHRQ